MPITTPATDQIKEHKYSGGFGIPCPASSYAEMLKSLGVKTPQVYYFEGKELSTLTNEEKARCKKCIKDYAFEYSLTGLINEKIDMVEIMQLLEPTEEHNA